jgi:hypothetical protein
MQLSKSLAGFAPGLPGPQAVFLTLYIFYHVTLRNASTFTIFFKKLLDQKSPLYWDLRAIVEKKFKLF